MSSLKPRSPFALFLDVDGTLIDMAAKPDAVVVPAALKRTLAALQQQLSGALALVSGRTIADLDALFDPLRFCAGGVHGAEIRFDPDGSIETSPDAMLPATVLASLRALHGRFAGTLLEDKHYSAAVHYRAVPAIRAHLEEQLAALVASSGIADLKTLPGHMVFEVKRAGFDKGIAITRLLEREPFKGRLPVFLGDDVTDEPGFAAVSARAGMAVAVGVPRPGSSDLIASPEAVRQWLAGLLEAPDRR